METNYELFLKVRKYGISVVKPGAERRALNTKSIHSFGCLGLTNPHEHGLQ